jgi:transposase
MDGSIVLAPKDRKMLLEMYRKSLDPAIRLRAHVVLLLADRYAWNQIAAMLFTTPRTISRWKKRFEREGVEAVFGKSRGRPLVLVTWWVAMVVRWVVQKTPRDFGFLRSRWSCGTLVLLLWEQQRLNVSAETVRRHLHREQLVWRRPRPVLGPKDPEYEQKLRAIRYLLAHLPDDETAVFQDEVDIHTQDRVDVDASGPTSGSGNARHQRQAPSGGFAALADGQTVGQRAEYATQCGTVCGPSGRPAATLALLSAHSRDLRQCQVP